ncbi:hypothetical protein JY651_45170 [Pyxidicoccus parkwayensis]|jgi:hypothetical protein|uniref:DUF3618 domain-containing protein n=1 Tax=Pyxidicoccus parkwayensis TaxID=2813578 RepID=A0ABX7NXZ6_9BACT|nr:hypothetical protein [Pyxidicoccus parkwaysis]QSQ22246.1 hypothetical protein JY651_45170 [Pyxidicoccus parkwaysis]
MNGNGRDKDAGAPVEIERHAGHSITRDMDDRKQVEQTADRIRDELLLTLGELDRRRERALNVRYQAEQHRDLLIGVGAVAMVAVGLGVGYAIYRSRHQEVKLRRQRREALRRAWEHPDSVAYAAKQRPLGTELGRKLVLIFVTSLATRIAQNSARTLVPAGQRPNPAGG